MKLRITKTVEVPDDILDWAVDYAQSAGHDYDGEQRTMTLLRRLFESSIVETLVRIKDYANEKEREWQ